MCELTVQVCFLINRQTAPSEGSRKSSGHLNDNVTVKPPETENKVLTVSEVHKVLVVVVGLSNFIFPLPTTDRYVFKPLCYFYLLLLLTVANRPEFSVEVAHLDKAGSTVRIMFFDFSSYFNTIQPVLLCKKLQKIHPAGCLSS